jgi:hypothetical protein
MLAAIEFDDQPPVSTNEVDVVPVTLLSVSVSAGRSQYGALSSTIWTLHAKGDKHTWSRSP